ncbi:5-methylcytosine-specific restriction endonuclease McrA [Oceanisphaera litoralis]|uniref:HNH endonuclease n=1 Tax=Oceanisphaera litoralis TaxID=225144 RepID=UPI001956AF08|nr:HNH endonuclease signature motif containing protein [Oceanisphaera litoralis]MBM7457267.1 5-methylcytosine-specific restriction endonuclease McrA [Oceanisphaera litoralis]
MDIELLKPTDRLRVMDLVEATGIDVSDWAKFKGGVEKAASNPKYCYEWSYEDHSKKIIVLNLWYENLSEKNGEIIQNLNLRDTAKNAASSPQSRRATKMDFSLQKAARLNWPVRVIICDGGRRDSNSTKSSADRRLLDSEQWYVKSYSSDSGDCVLVRGTSTEFFIDQFSIENIPIGEAKRKEATTSVYERSPQVRNYILKRAGGFCEWCGQEGFKTLSGSVYLETHHIQPLSENGSDTVDNVVALCPNHHREAHFGESAVQFRKELASRVEKLNKSIQPTANASADFGARLKI